MNRFKSINSVDFRDSIIKKNINFKFDKNSNYQRIINGSNQFQR